MTPKEKLKEIEEGKNDIYNFWSVRGYEEVRHILCMNITFHKKQKYESLGLSLQYLEQFKEQIIKAEREKTLDEVDKLLFDKHYHKKVYVRYKISGAELKRLRQIGER